MTEEHNEQFGQWVTADRATETGHGGPRPRLELLAEDARKGLARAAKGEAEAIAGWLIYGAALNEGRALFPGDREFGRWVSENVHPQVGGAPHDDDRAAAMWAAADRATETGHGRPRLSVRLRTLARPRDGSFLAEPYTGRRSARDQAVQNCAMG